MKYMIIAVCHVSIFYDYIAKDMWKIAKMREENYLMFNH